jgi:glycerol-3-phosphate dehydrogenase
VIRVAPSGLITITGGKWTTVRKMAEDCVDRAIQESGIQPRATKTTTLRLHGAADRPQRGRRAFYGTDLDAIEALERESVDLAQPLHESLPIRRSDIIWATRYEMARCVEDVLARRTRVLFLDARAAIAMAAEVASVMAGELGKDQAWCVDQVNRFREVARHYLPDRESPAG